VSGGRFYSDAMKYIDSGFREAEQTVAFWMQAALAAKIREVRCQAGYFTLDGSALLLPMLKQCAATGATVRLLLGSNGGATLASHIAFLAGTLGVPRENVSLGVVSFDNALFHPKVYHLVREDGSQTAYVGSANLTGPGLSGMNVEAGVILDTSDGDNEKPLHDIVERIEAWFARRSAGLSTITDHKDIDNLLEAGHLALKPVRRERDLEEEGLESSTRRREPRARLATIFDLPAVDHDEEAERTPARERERAPRRARGSRVELALFAGNTEASFHYPQGTHLGHILTILSHFAGNREGTAFDDEFIRLKGGLGTGRVAGYRRQIKYKLLAAIELGLITDVRLAENPRAYTPELTEPGRVLWGLLQPFVPVADLILDVDENGDYSASMPQQPAYTTICSRERRQNLPTFATCIDPSS
jgi:hypothetical protein